MTGGQFLFKKANQPNQEGIKYFSLPLVLVRTDLVSSTAQAWVESGKPDPFSLAEALSFRFSGFAHVKP